MVRKAVKTVKSASSEVPTVVPRGAENGAVESASQRIRLASDCTEDTERDEENGSLAIAVTGDGSTRIRTEPGEVASVCIEEARGGRKVSPTGVEPVTFGFGG
jgi:hypothetical protein